MGVADPDTAAVGDADTVSAAYGNCLELLRTHHGTDTGAPGRAV